jgi:hypothetical protein
MINRALAIVLLLITSGMPASAQKNTTAVPDWLTDTLFKLPEVIREGKWIDSASKGRRHLTIMVFPEKFHGTSYWHAEVCESNGVASVAYFHFYCWSKTGVIKYYDPQSGRAISLAAWRKMKPSWHER